MRVPCEQCNRFHRGPRCKPADERSVRVCLTLPGSVAEAMRACVPWGDRSGWLAGLVEAELELERETV